MIDEFRNLYNVTLLTMLFSVLIGFQIKPDSIILNNYGVSLKNAAISKSEHFSTSKAMKAYRHQTLSKGKSLYNPILSKFLTQIF